VVNNIIFAIAQLKIIFINKNKFKLRVMNTSFRNAYIKYFKKNRKAIATTIVELHTEQNALQKALFFKKGGGNMQ
jgi:hypothetical protein